jgi:uncharacterized protein (TIGR02001 family)
VVKGLLWDSMSPTFFFKATQKRCPDSHRWLRFVGVAWVLAIVGPVVESAAADAWGGSIGLTSDYLVRGVSRSSDGPSVQGDLHYVSRSGFIAGAFASSVKGYPGEGTGAELGGLVGFMWTIAEDWRCKGLLEHYAYAGGQESSNYDYDELTLDASYQEWVGVSVQYSPNFKRYTPYHGLVRAASSSVELNLQHSVYQKLSVMGGVGYAHLGGAGAGGYVYGSVGLTYDLSPLTLTVAYIDTSPEAKSLFYEQVPGGQWAGTVIWRFK